MPSRQYPAIRKDNQESNYSSGKREELTPEEIVMLLNVLTRVKHTVAYLLKNNREYREKNKKTRSKPSDYRLFNSLYAKVQTWVEGGK